MDSVYQKTPEGLTEKYFTRAGCEIHYWDSMQANSPVIIFLHGATMDHRMFNEQVNAFSKHYRVIVMDVRGHGKSRPLTSAFTLHECAHDLKAILDREQIEAAIVCGQSMGGYIAQYFYRHYPECVAALAILGATDIAQPYSRWEIWALKATLPLFSIWPFAHFSRIVARNAAITPAAREYALQTIHQLGQKDMLPIWRAVTLAIDTKGMDEHQIRVPLLLTHGDQDTAGTIRRDMPHWAKRVEHAQYVVIPNAGHNANQDNAAFFNAVLYEFLEAHLPMQTSH